MSLSQAYTMISGRIWDIDAIHILAGELTTLSLTEQYRSSEDSKQRTFSLHPLVQDWLKIRGSQDDREFCFYLAVCILSGCVAARQASSARQQMSLPAGGEIRILQYLEALQADSRLEIERKSAVPGSLYERLQPVVQRMSATMYKLRAEQWLTTSNPYDYHQSTLEQAAPGTGSNVLGHADFQQWTKSSRHDRILSLRGHILLSRGWNIAFYALARALRQSSEALASFKAARLLLDDEVRNTQKLYEEHLAEKVTDDFTTILTILHQGISRLEDCYIVLDGLDICPSDIFQKLMEAFNLLLQLRYVKLMVVARSPWLIRDNLVKFESLEIDFDPDSGRSPDKTKYIDNHIAAWPMNRELKSMVEEIVWGPSAKSFLYIRFLLDDLKNIRSQEDVNRQVVALPETLDDFLTSLLFHILQADDTMRKHSLLMITSDLCAQAPMPLTALHPVFYLDLEVNNFDNAVSYFRTITGNLITFHGARGIPYFTHSSVKEYLEESRSGRTWTAYRSAMGGRSTGLRSVPYDHASFTIECFKQLSQEPLDFGADGPSFEQAQDVSRMSRLSLNLRYAVVYWGAHVTLYHQGFQADEHEFEDFEYRTRIEGKADDLNK
ncbi:hypothetical protein BKA64DRAFT_765680 [Cadophora sp. MPI-SDFR-AT-0126]|nr:hypothetical protein BKA64DRAFT_765680 [Leotiomycetes sp. MPI-SDFR-AT-0126]